MNAIQPKTVEYVAKLARLELTEDEVTRFSGDLSRILEMVEQLNQLDLSQVEVNLSLEHEPVLRPDRQVDGPSREALLQNAPAPEDGFFRVPKILSS